MQGMLAREGADGAVAGISSRVVLTLAASPSVEGEVRQVGQKVQYCGRGTKSRLATLTVRNAGLRANTGAGRTAGHPGGRVARVMDMSKGGYEGMQRVRRSLEHADPNRPSVEIVAEIVELEAVPAEAPGVFIEQPLERWSPRDLITGVFRLVRWTWLATS